MSPFRLLAAELGTSDRSLRRAANRGMIRAERIGPRRAEISLGERAYLRRHWPLLSCLVTALRTEPRVRLAVLFGSTARGDDDRESDIDIAVSISGDELGALVELEGRLEQAVDRRVQLLSFDQALRDPMLPAEIVRDGRVLVDRENEWHGPWRSQVLSEAQVNEWLDDLGRRAVKQGRRFLSAR